MSLFDALSDLKSYKPNANPNEGFCRQLLEYERKVRGSVSMRFSIENPVKGKQKGKKGNLRRYSLT
jgi:hypothetical protein